MKTSLAFAHSSILILNIPKGILKRQIRYKMSSHGIITRMVILPMKNQNWNRMAFIKYKFSSSVRSALNWSFLKIGNHSLPIRKAYGINYAPRNSQNANQNGNDNNNNALTTNSSDLITGEETNTDDDYNNNNDTEEVMETEDDVLDLDTPQLEDVEDEEQIESSRIVLHSNSCLCLSCIDKKLNCLKLDLLTIEKDKYNNKKIEDPIKSIKEYKELVELELAVSELIIDLVNVREKILLKSN